MVVASTPPADRLLTVPELAAEIGVPVDRLRKVLRRRADLAALFRFVGPTRVLPGDRVGEVRDAVHRG